MRECNVGAISRNKRNPFKVSECITCSCIDAEEHCLQEQCPQLECDDAVEVEGECCPQCPGMLLYMMFKLWLQFFMIDFRKVM